MTLTSGGLGTSVVGSDHVDWLCTYAMVRLNAINPDLLNNILSGNVMLPKVRVYAEEKATGTLTEIGEVTTYARAENARDSLKGTFSGTVKPEKISTTFTNLFTSEIFPSNEYWFVIKAGYVWEGTEILVSIFKGVQKDRFSFYGRAGGSLNINGFDFSDRLELVKGEWNGSSYGTAKALIKAVVNEAGITVLDLDDLTDFSVANVTFVNNNGLQTIERLKDFSQFSWYFDGAGVFVARDIPTDSTVKYDYSDSGIQSLNIETTSRQIVTEVNVIGDGITLVRRTDSTDQAKYGRINQFLQNSLITTTAEAQTAADDIINESRRQGIQMITSFNPFLYIDDIINISHQEIGDDQKYRVTGFTHFFDGQTAKTNIKAEEVNPDLPTILTIV